MRRLNVFLSQIEFSLVFNIIRHNFSQTKTTTALWIKPNPILYLL